MLLSPPKPQNARLTPAPPPAVSTAHACEEGVYEGPRMPPSQNTYPVLFSALQLESHWLDCSHMIKPRFVGNWDINDFILYIYAMEYY